MEVQPLKKLFFSATSKKDLSSSEYVLTTAVTISSVKEACEIYSFNYHSIILTKVEINRLLIKSTQSFPPCPSNKQNILAFIWLLVSGTIPFVLRRRDIRSSIVSRPF